jgi:Tfp pilus assembly protein PilN
LFVAQGIGAIFVGVFLAAYLSGLPSTSVLHSEPAFRIPLYIFGVVLLVMMMVAAVLAVLSKKDQEAAVNRNALLNPSEFKTERF